MYRGSKRVVVCEEFLDGGAGEVPRDYKFFCFHGEPRFVQVDYDRFSGHTRTLYDMEWKKLPCEFEYPYGPDESGHPPELFNQMTEIAKKLSNPFPFVRVDLYESGGSVWFGEMTFCPGKACERFNPKKYDLEFGKFLDLNRITEIQAAQKSLTSTTYEDEFSGGGQATGSLISVPIIGTHLLVPNPHVPYVDSTRVLGTSLMETTYAELSTFLLEAGSSGGGVLAVDFANTHVVTMRRHDPKFMNLTACIDLIAPDGMPLVWAMNAKGANLEDRVYGPTFTRRFLASCPADKTHYLVGGSEECGRRFREQMLALNPSLNFVGGYHGRCSGDGELDDQRKVTADILEKRPDFIWVGLGTPKQYAWIHRIKPQLDRGVLLAVGFAFDVNAGMKADAPIWMQRAGLTWLHRMATEPRRLLGRYLKWNTLFLWYWMKDGGWRSEDGVGESNAEGSRPDSTIRRWKLMVRNLGLKLIALFSTEIRDCVTGQSLGKGLVLSLGGRPLVIGHPGLPPLIPRFLSQKRLTYWKQSIGFTTHRRPDYPRLACVKSPHGDSARVMNVVLTHLGGAAMERTLNNWKAICREENLWIAFGGSQDGFEALEYPRKVFVDDPYLRRIDNQRQKQSYTGIFRAMAPVVEREKPDFIYLCEYDHLPLVPDLNCRQVAEIRRKDADVMGHWLHRVDGTSNYHMLYHETDPGFAPFWRSFSRREDAGTVFSMFGSGSLWSREAFLAVASHPCPIACYLELYLPTLVHHLGFRVCGWDEEQHLLSNLPSRAISEAQGRRRGAWTVHPVKG